MVTTVEGEATEIPFEAGETEPPPPKAPGQQEPKKKVPPAAKVKDPDAFNRFWGSGFEKADVYSRFDIPDKTGSFRKYVVDRAKKEKISEGEVLTAMIEALEDSTEVEGVTA